MNEVEFLQYLVKQGDLSESLLYQRVDEFKKAQESTSLLYFVPTEEIKLLQEIEEFAKKVETPTLSKVEKPVLSNEEIFEEAKKINKKAKLALEKVIRTQVIQQTLADSKKTNDFSFIPNQVERYERIKKIGEGGMGYVEEVRDKTLGREVALKRIKLSMFKRDTEDQKFLMWRFYQEALILGNLEHPNIVPLYDMEKDGEGSCYFTMRKIEGESLRSLLKHRREENREYSQNDILTTFMKICDAVSYAHSKGVIHRDLKPDNIMMGKFGEVYVIDWGIAKTKRDGSSKLEEVLRRFTASEEDRKVLYQTIGGIGTQGYMAPEQEENAENVTEQSDVYSLGHILKECFTGLSPTESFRKEIENRREFEKSIQKIPAELQAAIEKATKKDRQERYKDVESVRKDIEHFLQRKRITAKKYDLFEIVLNWGFRNFTLLGILFFLFIFFYYNWLSLKYREDLENANEKLNSLEKEKEGVIQYLRKQDFRDPKSIINGINNPNKMLNALLVLQSNYLNSDEIINTILNKIKSFEYEYRDLNCNLIVDFLKKNFSIIIQKFIQRAENYTIEEIENSMSFFVQLQVQHRLLGKSEDIPKEFLKIISTKLAETKKIKKIHIMSFLYVIKEKNKEIFLAFCDSLLKTIDIENDSYIWGFRSIDELIFITKNNSLIKNDKEIFFKSLELLELLEKVNKRQLHECYKIGLTTYGDEGQVVKLSRLIFPVKENLRNIAIDVIPFLIDALNSENQALQITSAKILQNSPKILETLDQQNRKRTNKILLNQELNNHLDIKFLDESHEIRATTIDRALFWITPLVFFWILMRNKLKILKVIKISSKKIRIWRISFFIVGIYVTIFLFILFFTRHPHNPDLRDIFFFPFYWIIESIQHYIFFSSWRMFFQYFRNTIEMFFVLILGSLSFLCFACSCSIKILDHNKK